MLDRQALDIGALDETSDQFLGQWNRLVSTTNWAKGKIIADWRAALQAAGADPAEFADEAWSRRVGNVTGQHVGRLRRVFERFGASYTSYPGLFWSHFQAALDWHDAEMWLEGAVQNSWSIAGMRSERYEALQPADEAPPRDDDIVSAELDEDRDDASDAVQTLPQGVSQFDHPGGPEEFSSASSGASFESAPRASDDEPAPWDDGPGYSDAAGDERVAVAPVRPFARLADLPPDLHEAFDAFKLALLHHKLDGWREISRDDALASLDALKQLALAPTEA